MLKRLDSGDHGKVVSSDSSKLLSNHNQFGMARFDYLSFYKRGNDAHVGGNLAKVPSNKR